MIDDRFDCLLSTGLSFVLCSDIQFSDQIVNVRRIVLITYAPRSLAAGSVCIWVRSWNDVCFTIEHCYHIDESQGVTMSLFEV